MIDENVYWWIQMTGDILKMIGRKGAPSLTIIMSTP